MDETLDQLALQQLREELLARLWAMHTISPTNLSGAVPPDTTQRADAAARRWWHMLRDPDPAARREAGSVIERVLWPAFSAPADEWWTTPLAAALLALRPGTASTATADERPNERSLVPQ